MFEPQGVHNEATLSTFLESCLQLTGQLLEKLKAAILSFYGCVYKKNYATNLIKEGC